MRLVTYTKNKSYNNYFKSWRNNIKYKYKMNNDD